MGLVAQATGVGTPSPAISGTEAGRTGRGGGDAQQPVHTCPGGLLVPAGETLSMVPERSLRLTARRIEAMITLKLLMLLVTQSAGSRVAQSGEFFRPQRNKTPPHVGCV